MNVMFDCVCECTDFKHNFKSEKETKSALGTLAELLQERLSYAKWFEGCNGFSVATYIVNISINPPRLNAVWIVTYKQIILFHFHFSNNDSTAIVCIDIVSF